MTAVTFEVRISAIAEVRDADGNLVSQSPVELIGHLTEDEVAELARQQEEARQ